MSVSEDNPGKRKYNDGFKKRGRKELRTIRRAANGYKSRDKLETEESDNSKHETNAAPKFETMGKFSKRKHAVDDSEESKDLAYKALLTILKSEHPTRRSHKQRKKLNVDSVTSLEKDLSSDQDGEDGDVDDMENLEENLERVTEEHSDEEALDDDDELGNIKDPFEYHFNQVSEDLLDTLDRGFKDKSVQYKMKKVAVSESEQMIYGKPSLNDLDAEQVDLSDFNKKSLQSYFLKQRLKIQNDLLDSDNNNLTPLQKTIVDPMFQYNDLLYEYNSYEEDEDQYRYLYVLHILNHIYKTRDRILKNNQRQSDNPDGEYLDQGFTRPKVLIVLPTRDTAYQVVNKIIQESGIDQVDKKSKFKDQFYEDSQLPESKPKSFQRVFKGNSNDFFVLGMKFTRKAIKLYSNFYQSDIILCSPLGLQLIIENTDKKKRQDDFLSSIEITIFDQLHSIEFQNFSHVLSIFDHINKIPQEQHDTDFGRVRMWYINEQATLLRQTMIFTRYITPMANSLLNNRCRNWVGRWKNHHTIPAAKSSIGKLGFSVRQIFQRIDLGGASVADESDFRFKYFTSVVIPSIVKTTGYEDGILLYIPDYADFVRILNYLKDKTTILFGDINEYSDQRQLNSSRALFQQGRIKMLLYTERLHHFRRYEVKGVKSVIFYQPPANPEFYNEVVRFIAKSSFLGETDLNISTVRCIYSKLDGLSLERVVGTKRAAILTHAQNEVYEFK